MSTIKSSDEHLTLNADGSSKDIKLQSNASEKVIIKSDGKVGIGETTPDRTLHIQGTAKIRNASTSYLDMYCSGGGNRDWQVGVNGANFVINDVTSGTSEKLRIQSGGGISFNGDTAAANALDDYEEGTWTPTVTGSSSGSGNAGSGYYTKIGRVCTISYVVNNTAFPTISGDLRISLPFTSAANQECHGSDIYFYPLSAWTSGSNFTGLIPKVGSSVSYHTFIVKGVNVDRQSNLSSSNSSISGNSNTYARYSMTYITV